MPEEQKTSKNSELKLLSIATYLLAVLVLLVAWRGAFYHSDEAKITVLLILAAGAMIWLPLVIPLIEKVKIKDIEFTMRSLQAKLKETEEFVEDLVTEKAKREGLVGGSKKRARSRN